MATTQASEILLLKNRNVYNIENSQNGSLKKSFYKLADWCINPKDFPYYESNNGQVKGIKYVGYFEILNSLWPYNNASLLLKKFRPFTSVASFPDLTFTHGNLGSELTLTL